MRDPPLKKPRIEGRMYYTQIIRIPRRGISPSPPGGSRIPPGGIRGVLYMYPRPRAFFEGGMPHPPRWIKHPPVFRGFSLSLGRANERGVEGGAAKMR